MLVELIDGAIIAEQALDDAIALGRGPVRGGEKTLGGSEIGKVGLLQSLVGERLGARCGIIALAIGEIFEEFGRLSEPAAVIACVSLGPCC
jgi:hypothetical protein